MKRPAFLLLLLTMATHLANAAGPAARPVFRDGLKAHEAQDFTRAAELFAQAGRQAPLEKLDPAVACHNEGHALYRAGKFDEAFAAFSRARQTTDLALQAKALYGAATCRIRQVALALEMKQGEYIEPYLAEAQALYEQALLLSPSDMDTKINLELVQAQRAALQRGVEQLQLVISQAGSALDQYRFEQAHALLQDAQQKLAPVLALPRPEAKSFQTLLQRCEQVLGILHQAEPPAPAPATPGGSV
jgi:tetratricopeptide (TPR) repeat protein